MPEESGGWYRYDPPPGRAELDAVRRRTEAFLAEEDQRIESARASEFGSDTDICVQRVAMPLSRFTFEWRSDGWFRCLDPDDAEDWADVEWETWDPDHDSMTGLGEAVAGDRAAATWWLWWGQARPEQKVAAWLADDTDVAVARLGYLWIAEWSGTAQTMFVAIDGEVTAVKVHRPNYLPPPRYPVPRNAPDPRRRH
jgi:hypothetical protein